MANIIQTFPAGSGGGGGTSNYNDLTNKPQIAGNTLSGNVALSTLGLTSSVLGSSSGGTAKSYVTSGEKYTWETCGTVYGTCTTSASTTAKSVTLARGTLNFTAGAKIAIKFTYTNTASAPTLTINSTTKNIKYIDADGNVSTPLIWWNAGDIVEFVYDGTQFLMQPTMQMLFAGQGTKIPREQIYSTTEKVVGCWTDGKPVYQKVIADTTGTTSGTKYVSIGASTDKIISCELVLEDANGVYLSAKGLNIVKSALSGSSVSGIRIIAKNGSAAQNPNSLLIDTTNPTWELRPFYAIVQYTKTTDAANSFKYSDPNDYSTTEKIVGTWIDGKPLYQKTINFGALPNTTGISKYVDPGISAQYVKKMFGIATNGSTTIAIPHTPADQGSTSGVSVFVDSLGLGVAVGRDRSAFSAYITIQYTKS